MWSNPNILYLCLFLSLTSLLLSLTIKLVYINRLHAHIHGLTYIQEQMQRQINHGIIAKAPLPSASLSSPPFVTSLQHSPEVNYYQIDGSSSSTNTLDRNIKEEITQLVNQSSPDELESLGSLGDLKSDVLDLNSPSIRLDDLPNASQTPAPDNDSQKLTIQFKRRLDI